MTKFQELRELVITSSTAELKKETLSVVPECDCCCCPRAALNSIAADFAVVSDVPVELLFHVNSC